MSSPDVLVVGVYFAVLAGLSVYGAHRGYLLYLYTNGRRPGRRPPPRNPAPAAQASRPPRLTVQLPLFNERYVVERLIDAVAHLRYPRDRFEVQVLDDSTDATSRAARAGMTAGLTDHWPLSTHHCLFHCRKYGMTCLPISRRALMILSCGSLPYCMKHST